MRPLGTGLLWRPHNRLISRSHSKWTQRHIKKKHYVILYKLKACEIMIKDFIRLLTDWKKFDDSWKISCKFLYLRKIVFIFVVKLILPWSPLSFEILQFIPCSISQKHSREISSENTFLVNVSSKFTLALILRWFFCTLHSRIFVFPSNGINLT